MVSLCLFLCGVVCSQNDAPSSLDLLEPVHAAAVTNETRYKRYHLVAETDITKVMTEGAPEVRTRIRIAMKAEGDRVIAKYKSVTGASEPDWDNVPENTWLERAGKMWLYLPEQMSLYITEKGKYQPLLMEVDVRPNRLWYHFNNKIPMTHLFSPDRIRKLGLNVRVEHLNASDIVVSYDPPEGPTAAACTSFTSSLEFGANITAWKREKDGFTSSCQYVWVPDGQGGFRLSTMHYIQDTPKVDFHVNILEFDANPKTEPDVEFNLSYLKLKPGTNVSEHGATTKLYTYKSEAAPKFLPADALTELGELLRGQGFAAPKETDK